VLEWALTIQRLTLIRGTIAGGGNNEKLLVMQVRLERSNVNSVKRVYLVLGISEREGAPKVRLPIEDIAQHCFVNAGKASTGKILRKS